MIRQRQVEAFAETVRTGSTVAAARSLHTSQPTISRLIAQLRDQVGFQLFANHGGRLTLTKEGKLFYKDVEQFLMTTRELERRARQIRNYEISQIRLSTIPSVNLQIVPDALAELQREFDNLSFGVIQAEHHEAKVAIASGKVDLGICNKILPSDNLQVFEKVMFKCMLAVPEDHVLSYQAVVTAGDLAGHPFISLGDGFFSDYLEDDVARRIIRENTKNFASLSAPLISLVEAGNGVGIADPISASYYTRDRVIFLPFEPAVSFPIFIAYKSGAQLSGVAERLCTILFRLLTEAADVTSR